MDFNLPFEKSGVPVFLIALVLVLLIYSISKDL